MEQFRPEYRDRKSYKYDKKELRNIIDGSGILYGRAVEVLQSGEVLVNIGTVNGDVIECTISDDELYYEHVAKCGKVSLIGRLIALVCIEVKDDCNIVGSRKKAQQICYEQFILNLRSGDIVNSAVISVTDFGVFCDIGCGVCALLPVGRLTISRIDDLATAYGWLDEIIVAIYKIDSDGKITVTHKELLGTWDDAVEELENNKTEIILGKVAEINKNGIFVTIGQNLSGIAYKFERGKVSVGDTVVVSVRAIYKKNTRVQLRIIEVTKSKYEVQKFKYKEFKNNHIDKWVYNPNDENSRKVIVTDFNAIG